MRAVEYKIYGAPPVNEREIMRYAGAHSPTQSDLQLLSSVLAELEGHLTFRTARAVVECEELTAMLGERSRTLERYLEPCRAVVLMAATVGLELDRLILKHSRLSPSRALMLQAVGAERVESLCDALEADIRIEHGRCAPRISCGYGDIPLTLQRALVRELELGRRLGISLSEGMLMTPSKSVTAIVGILKD